MLDDLLRLLLSLEHEFVDGKCVHCGVPQIFRKQKHTVINAIVLRPGDSIRVAPSPLDADGYLIEGEYYHEAIKTGPNEYVTKIIGQG